MSEAMEAVRKAPAISAAPETRKLARTDLAFAIWCAVSIAFWCLYSVVSGKFIPFALYYPIWLGAVGLPVWRYRRRLQDWIEGWGTFRAVKFLALGLGAVMSEETVAALANNLQEGFSPVLFAERIGQFWLLNIFTFFGFFLAWYILLAKVSFRRREVFYLAGFWGLFAEKVVFVIPANPAFFLFDFAPVAMTYGLILAPASFSFSRTEDARALPRALKYPLSYILMFACSVPAILLLQILRRSLPLLFPPASLVPP